MTRAVLRVGLILAVAIAAASCGGPSAATEAPTQPLPTETPGAPTATPAAPPTEAPTEAPTVAPTEPPPTAAPTATTPRESVAFNWAPGSVPPSDSDDVDIIAAELTTHAGILSANGNETVLNVFYDPTVITVEEIMEVLRQIGHPVVVNE